MHAKNLIPRRIAATIIDYTVICSFWFSFIWMFGTPNGQGGKIITGWPVLVPILFWFTWLVVAEAFSGTTPGHYIMKLKIINLQDEKITFGQAFIRRLCDGLEISWCFGLIAFLLVSGTPQRRRLGDLMAGTRVVDREHQLNRHIFDFEQESAAGQIP